MTSLEPFAAHTCSRSMPSPRYAARCSRSVVNSRSGYRLTVRSACSTAAVTCATTTSGIGCVFSLTLRAMRTGFCGAP